MCELLEFAFNPSSAKTTCVSSAREALKWLENERPDLMVLEGKRTCRDFFSAGLVRASGVPFCETVSAIDHVLRQFEPLGKAVSIPESGKITLEVKLIPAQQ